MIGASRLNCTVHLLGTNQALRCQSLRGELEPYRRLARRVCRLQGDCIAAYACRAIGARGASRTHCLILTKDAHIRMCFTGIDWPPETESNSRNTPSEGICRRSIGRENLVAHQGVDPCRCS
jgi:hypothetical protein